MSSLNKFIPRKSTLAITLLLAALNKAGRFNSKLTSYCFSLLLILNWRSFPGVWHLQLWGLVPKLHLKLHLYGPESLRVFSVAQDPFQKTVIKNGFVSLDVGDWNLHLSNTSYGKALDAARFKWLLEVVGPAMGEGIWSPLASTTFVFLKEIPILASYEIAINIISWDEKWIYYLARFTTAPPANSPAGTPRVLNCLALSKSCFKLNRLTIPPSRVLSFSGLGADRKNYLRMVELRKSKRGRAWLRFGSASAVSKREENGLVRNGNGNGSEKSNGAIVGKDDEKDWAIDGMEIYEERRIKGLESVEGFRDVSHWIDL